MKIIPLMYSSRFRNKQNENACNGTKSDLHVQSSMKLNDVKMIK